MKPARLCPYLKFDGDCRQAMEFYAAAMGGKLTMQTFGESGHSPDPSMNDRVMHAMLENGDDLSFMACDIMPGMGGPGPYVKGHRMDLSLSGTDDAKLRGFFEKLSAGGTVTMPLAKQFWGDVFGMFTDKFGNDWMVNIAEKKA